MYLMKLLPEGVILACHVLHNLQLQEKTHEVDDIVIEHYRLNIMDEI
jgi:hypothetical protein